MLWANNINRMIKIYLWRVLGFFVFICIMWHFKATRHSSSNNLIVSTLTGFGHELHGIACDIMTKYQFSDGDILVEERELVHCNLHPNAAISGSVNIEHSWSSGVQPSLSRPLTLLWMFRCGLWSVKVWTNLALRLVLWHSKSCLILHFDTINADRWRLK